jgi:phage gpG-like protein
MATGGYSVVVDLNAITADFYAIVNDLQNPQQLFRDVGIALVKQVKIGFIEGQSPYGEIWAKPAWRMINNKKVYRRGNIGRDWKPLLDTGILRNSITFQADANSVQVGTDISYGEQHQLGINGVKKRQFLPDSARGLPDSWELNVMGAVDLYLKAVINGSA